MTGREAGNEIELKYLLATPQQPSLPPGWSRVGEIRRVTLREEYLDSEGRLAAIGLRLRRRTGLGSTVRYTLKSERSAAISGAETPALHDRVEIESSELPGSPIAAAISAATAKIGKPIDLDALEVTLRIMQRRSEQRLARNGEECATLSFDEIEAELGEAQPSGGAVNWNELEIEFDGGGSAARLLAMELDELLRSQRELEPSTLSKPERAERLFSRRPSKNPD